MADLSEEKIRFLKENVKGKTVTELTELFNKKFDTMYRPSTIKWYKECYKIKSGQVSGNKVFTKERVKFLKDICEGKTIYEITKLFNKQFETDFNKKQVDNTMKRYKLKSGLDRNVARKMAFANKDIQSKYSDEQQKFIEENAKGTPLIELVKIFNYKFGTNFRETQIERYLYNHNFKNGIDATFKKGTVFKPGIIHQYKKGNVPLIQLPVGSEITTVDGYINVKIADPNKWKRKHILVWEKHNGPVSKGYVVVFGDKDRNNFDINNLILMSRVQLSIMNSKRLIQTNADATRTGVIIADIYHEITKIKNKSKGEFYEK